MYSIWLLLEEDASGRIFCDLTVNIRNNQEYIVAILRRIEREVANYRGNYY